MRAEIRNLLVESVHSVSRRVYEPSAAGPQLEKPFLVLREGVQSADEPYASYTTIYEVWPYVERTTFQNVDRLAEEVVSAIDKIRFNSNDIPNFIEYTGTITDDIVDEDWDVLTRGLRFRVFSLAWLTHVPVEPDPVEALKKWTKDSFQELQTNPLTWNPLDVKPALYWRQSSIQNVEPMNWGSWITARINGHIIAPDVTIRKEWTEKVVRKLALDTRTKMSDGSRMGFTNVSADSGYDPFQQGQVQLDVRYGILREKKEHEPLSWIDTGTNYGGVNIGKKE